MANREPNTRLAGLIRETGWKYSQFAREVNRLGTEQGTPLRYDESAVSHWLNGTMPRPLVRPVVLEALTRKLRRPVTHAEAGFPPPKSQPATGTSTVEEVIELGRQDMDPSRRSVLGAALFSAALTIPAWQEVVGRLEAVQTGRTSRIGHAEVNAVIAMTEKVSELDDMFGGRHARPMAAAFLVNTVAPHLQADATPEVRQAMLSAASDLLYLTGYMAVDEGLHGLAQRYYLQALELAGAAGNHLAYCTTLRGMSVQAVDLGHGPAALRLADAAAAASPKAGPRMVAFLTGQQAHSAAQQGERRAALRFIREAEAAMDRAESRSKAFGSYDPAALNYHIAQVRYELGDVAGSIEALERSNKLRYSVYRRGNVRMRALLAERQLRVGHLEEAVTTWHAALDDYPFVQSGRVDQRFVTMRSVIRPYLKHPGAAELYERAQALGAGEAA